MEKRQLHLDHTIFGLKKAGKFCNEQKITKHYQLTILN